jgi:hypothetical protein
MSDQAAPQPVDIQVLFTNGCANTPPTVALVAKVAADLDIQIRLRRVRTDSVKQAVEKRFLGSPTVLVNGLDIDRAAETALLMALSDGATGRRARPRERSSSKR